MASPGPVRQNGALIADQYLVDAGRMLPAVGGLAACGAADQLSGRADLMAIRLDRSLPPRPRAFQALLTPIDSLLTPLAYGTAGDACYAICVAPPGPASSAASGPGRRRSCSTACFARRRTCSSTCTSAA